MTWTRILLVLAVVSLAAGCGGGDEEFGGSLEVPLRAQNASGYDGEATLEEVDADTTRVEVVIQTPSDNPQPAHIHRGTCQNLDAEPAYPLDNVVDGRSTTEIDVAIEDLIGHGYAVNVHKSAAEAQIYVACGDIETLPSPS